jgi:hypothetical protein
VSDTLHLVIAISASVAHGHTSNARGGTRRRPEEGAAMPGDDNQTARKFAAKHAGKQVCEDISGRTGTVRGSDGPNVRIVTCTGLEFQSPARRLNVV